MFIALTGGIASGKNFIADLFQAKCDNISILDADEVSRIVMGKGEEAFNGIVAYFGEEVLSPSGEIDRKKLRENIVDSMGARYELEMIIHPAVFNYTTIWYEELMRANSAAVAIYHAPLILEASLRRLVKDVCSEKESNYKLQELCASDYLNLDQLSTLKQHRYLFNNRKRNKDAKRHNLDSILPYYDYILLINTAEAIQLERLKSRGYPPYEDGVKLMQAQMIFEERKPFADLIIDNNGTRDDTKQQVDYIYNKLINS